MSAARDAHHVVDECPEQACAAASTTARPSGCSLCASSAAASLDTALDQLLLFDVAVVVPGHGPESRQPRDDIALTRDYLLAYLRKTMGAAAREMEPFDEAYKRTDWSRFKGLSTPLRLKLISALCHEEKNVSQLLAEIAVPCRLHPDRQRDRCRRRNAAERAAGAGVAPALRRRATAAALAVSRRA